jgi:purine nucleosidase
VAVSLVVDTDIGSDVDDALALALAVRHPDLELRAVTTVSSQPDVRAQLARRLLDVAGAVDVEVAVGTNVAGDERNAIGAEHLDLLAPPSDGAPAANAVDLLAGLGRDMSLATIGQQTNLAAALARDSALARRAASLTVMGGAFAPIDGTGGEAHGASRDWNLVLDPRAAVVSLSSGWRTLRYVPIDVTFGVPLSRAHTERLRGGDELCVLLAGLVDGWRGRAFPDHGPPDVACYLHDPLTVACVTECEFIEAARLPVSIVVDGSGVAHTVIDPTEGRPATVVRAVDAPAFADWLVDTLINP